ncbi:ultraviolet-B receptor UVR8 [Iris pallida]|uniref:Ultraviolet-B receptor UVR8 n=1 Tax=Iris pallida TaxID=29817 RepID=A0AAX6H3B8_IRIPA|nr:ultraviolet-B receptor UVR8 [Iris pallida]
MFVQVLFICKYVFVFSFLHKLKARSMGLAVAHHSFPDFH